MEFYKKLIWGEDQKWISDNISNIVVTQACLQIQNGLVEQMRRSLLEMSRSYLT